MSNKYKIPLLEQYIIKTPAGDAIITTQAYLLDLEYEYQVKFSTSEKSKFLFIVDYFRDKPFTRQNFRMMLHQLRTGEIGKTGKPLNVMTLNKYILTGGYIDKHLRLHELVDYPTFKRDKAAEPKGDLLTDQEMKQIAECYVKRGRRLSERDRASNIMFSTAIHLMRYTGMPPDDLVNLRWSNDKITHFDVFRNKTRLDRIVPIVPDVRRGLDEMTRYKHGFVFAFPHGQMAEQTLRLEIQRRAKKLGIQKWVTCYSFRYSMVTWTYINAEENTLSMLSKITGHTIATAHKHYLKYNIDVLRDALYATHPALIQNQSIDVAKRLAIQFLAKFISLSQYEIDITITPKSPNKRRIHLS